MIVYENGEQEGLMMDGEQEPWHECINTKCSSIFDSDENQCPACGTETFVTLYLTVEEVFNRVMLPSQIWTKRPKKFYELLDEREKILAQEEVEAQAVSV
jgi:hypothetical protein